MRTTAKIAILALAMMSLRAAEPERRSLGSISSGTTIPQIAVGDNTWSTEFQIMNLEKDPVAFTLGFYNTQGNTMPLDLYDTNDQFIGRMSKFSGQVPLVGAVFLRTRNTGLLQEGYAVLENTDPRKVSVTAIITNSFAGQTNFRASVPALATFNHTLRTPFTNTQGFNTCVAIKSDAGAIQNVEVIARDANGGDLLPRYHFTLPARQHEAFCLHEILPQTIGRQGVVEIIVNTGITGIAFTFDPGGRFWTQIPYDVDLF